MRSKFYIYARHDDIHAIAINWAINKLGLDSTVLSFDDIIFNEKTVSFSTHEGRMFPHFYDFPIKTDEIEAVWFRKHIRPVNFTNYTEKISLFEQGNFDETYTDFIRNALFSLCPPEQSINHPLYAFPASHKPYQLSMLQLKNIKIPKTYIGRCAPSVRSMFSNYSKVVYKPLRHNIWLQGKHAAVSTTEIVCLDEISSDEPIMMPGIFQELLEKSAEYRVNVFGDKCIAVEQKPTLEYNGGVDWRFPQAKNGKLVEKTVTLPEEIEAECINIVKKLFLQFGAIDIAKVGENYYFLEVNPYGQFIGYEEDFPETYLLRESVRLMLKLSTKDHKEFDLRNITYNMFLEEHFDGINTIDKFVEDNYKYPVVRKTISLDHN